jgi:cation:H+ antiporter
MFTVLSLMGGLMFLAMGAYALIRGTAGLTQLAGVAPFIIGLVVVSFGSSTPQFFTALQATRTGAEDMALATALGASIFNIFATLGVVALTGGAVHLNKRLWLRGSVALMLMATVTAAVVLYFGTAAPLPRWVGAVGILALITYVAAAYRYDHKHPQPLPMLKETRKYPPFVIFGLFLAGLFSISLGAILMVDAATQLTQLYNLNPLFLGLTVLAVGTALPQLIGAFRTFGDKQQHGQLLSNLIGNTIFNLLGVCGILFMLNPVQFNQGGLLRTSFVVLAAATLAFAIFTHPAMRRFKRAEATLFLLAYILYIAFVIHSL